ASSTSPSSTSSRPRCDWAASTRRSVWCRARSIRSAGMARRTSPSAPGWMTRMLATAHLATKHREHRLVASAGRRKRGAGVDRGPAVEVREPATGLLDEQHAGCQVPGLEVDLDIDLGFALGYETVADVVTEAALAVGRLDETDEAVPVARPPEEA